MRIWQLSIISFLFLIQCKPSQKKESELSASMAANYKTQIALYNKILGVQPNFLDIKPMKDMTLEKQLDYLMKLDDYKSEAFFNLHIDRLLLHPESEQSWFENSREDYCSLKWSFEEAAKEDLEGLGYWSLLQQNKLWLPANELYSNRNFGFACDSWTLDSFTKAIKESGVKYAGEMGAIEVGQCANYLSNRFSIYLPPEFYTDGKLDFIRLTNYMSGLPSSERAQSINRSRTLASFVIKKDIENKLGTRKGASIEVNRNGKVVIRKLTDKNTCKYTQEEMNLLDAGDFSKEKRFYQISLDKVYSGIHSHPYYLNRHNVDENNRHLHRARLIFFSYFCANISPDAANVTSGPPTKIPELEEYFDPTDMHVNASANCYDCHTKIQPVANYFLFSADGRNYADERNDSISIGSNRATARKGGFFDGQSLYQAPGEPYGMSGLYNLLSSHPQVKSCIADYTWSHLVGPNYPLTEKERKDAVAAFSKKPSRLSNLIKHLVLENERGRLYFKDGETTMAKVETHEKIDCEKVLSNNNAAKLDLAVKNNCAASCHTKPFSDNQGKIKDEIYFPNLQERSKENKAKLFKAIHCQIKTGKMPPLGSGITLSKESKDLLLCETEKTVKLLSENANIECTNNTPSFIEGVNHAMP